MLIETGKGTRRLYRSGDPFHPSRKSGKTVPNREEIPEKYHALLEWYTNKYDAPKSGENRDSILALRGLGKEIWDGVDPDEYVRELRKGWE